MIFGLLGRIDGDQSEWIATLVVYISREIRSRLAISFRFEFIVCWRSYLVKVDGVDCMDVLSCIVSAGVHVLTRQVDSKGWLIFKGWLS